MSEVTEMTTAPRGSCLITCSPDGGMVWEGLRGMTLFKEVCHWGQALRFQKTSVTPSLLSASFWGSSFECQLLLQPPAALRSPTFHSRPHLKL